MEDDNKPRVRDAAGRYVKGGPPGPGRPPQKREVEYLETLASVCSLDKWTAIVERAVQDAEDGDDRARAWLSSYLIGRPLTVQIDVSETKTVNILGMSEKEARQFLERRGRVLLPDERNLLIGPQVEAPEREEPR